jgi:hypothetical protein
LRVVTLAHPHGVPNAKIPKVLLPVAEPQDVAAVAAPPAVTAKLEYVYLSRVVTRVAPAVPSAKIPTVLLPAAEPEYDAAVALVAEEAASGNATARKPQRENATGAIACGGAVG